MGRKVMSWIDRACSLIYPEYIILTVFEAQSAAGTTIMTGSRPFELIDADPERIVRPFTIAKRSTGDAADAMTPSFLGKSRTFVVLASLRCPLMRLVGIERASFVIHLTIKLFTACLEIERAWPLAWESKRITLEIFAANSSDRGL
ncbi:hypothetical protein K0M31_010307 [Melipona bicolor]|uniref:Uncharacterized protein n=1 Tax=Melipona bicolor TaxID=60889 RepID=A0AA40FMD2_9HYME|nr:hypothetical protein K0M31_010307 [Melipona bicolor]